MSENNANIIHASPKSEKGQERLSLMDEVQDAKIIGSLDAEQTRKVRERQSGRSKMMGLVLAALAILFFAITIVKVGVWG